MVEKIKKIKFITKNYFKTIHSLFHAADVDDCYSSLAPRGDVDKDGAYSNALKWALNNSDVSNIALSGKYGSGKSSILKTFFSQPQNSKYNQLTVSLANFKGNQMKKNNEYYQNIEKSILQQLIYRVEEQTVPLSRFKRISKISFLNTMKWAIIILIGLIPLILFNFPFIIDFYKNNINQLKSIVPDWSINVMAGIFVLFIIYIVYRSVVLIKYKIRINKLKILDVDIEITGKNESIFNKYLDEIMYFFQVTGYDVVIIEDLDRFGADVTKIFSKLRELNILLNSSQQIKNQINFIYAIKDDYFEDHEQRTKFFDYIIPVIPVTTNGNANEIMWNNLENFRKKGKIKYNFDKDFINDIAIYISDNRVIVNIINEFMIYKNKYNKDNLSDSQLFSLITYKNIYPAEYAKLLDGKGRVYEVFNNLDLKIELIIKNKRDEKIKFQVAKDLAVKEKYNSLREMKIILIASRNNFSSNGDQKIILNGQEITIASFLNDDVTIADIEQKTIKFKENYYSSSVISEEDFFSPFETKEMFIMRVHNIINGLDNTLIDYQSKIENIVKEIEHIKNLKLSKLIENYGIEQFSDNLNNFEKKVLTNGYIDDSYKKYLTIFIPGDLSEEDFEYYLSVKNGTSLPFDYPLSKIPNIIANLNSCDFKTTSLLNFNLIYELFNNSKFLQYKEMVINLFQDLDELKYDFLEKYIEIYGCTDDFINKIIKECTSLWQYIYINKVGNNSTIDKWILILLKNNIQKEYIDQNFIDYISQNSYFNTLDINRDILDCLKKLNIKFKNIQSMVNDVFFQYIYENNMYLLNENMILKIFDFVDIKHSDIISKNLEIINNESNLSYMKTYIDDNFNLYYQNYYIKHEKYNNQEVILEKYLNLEEIDIEIKKDIVIRENCKLTNLTNYDVSLYGTIFENDKFEITLLNMVILNNNQFNNFDTVNDNILIIINQMKNIDSRIEMDQLNNFYQEFILSNEITFDNFKLMVDNYDYDFNSLDFEELSSEKLDYLIENHYITLTVETFSEIKTISSMATVLLISKNIDVYETNITEYDVGGLENEILNTNDISREDKKIIIENLEIELLTLKETTLYMLLANGIVDITNSPVFEKVLLSDLATEKKLMLLLKYASIFQKEDIFKSLRVVGKPYSDIYSKLFVANLPRTEINLSLAQFLLDKDYISSVKDGKNNNILLYKKRS